MTSERERVAHAIEPQISEGIGAILRKFCDSKEASIAREKLHALPDNEWYCLIGMLSEASAAAAIAAMDTRADAFREAAALGRAMTKAGCTPGKIWRKLDAMSEQAQPQPADQKRDEDTGPG